MTSSYIIAIGCGIAMIGAAKCNEISMSVFFGILMIFNLCIAYKRMWMSEEKE